MNIDALYPLRQRASVAAATVAGCVFPGAVGAWWMSNDYTLESVRIACMCAPLLALLAYAVSWAALDLLKDVPRYLREGAWRHTTMPIGIAWLLSWGIAPAGALALAFSAMGSLAAAHAWRTSARG